MLGNKAVGACLKPDALRNELTERALSSLAEQLIQIPSAVHNAKNEHIFVLDKVNDNVLTDRKTAEPNAKVIVAGTSQVRMDSQQEKPLSDGINELVGDLDASALFGDVVPDVVEVG